MELEWPVQLCACELTARLKDNHRIVLAIYSYSCDYIILSKKLEREDIATAKSAREEVWHFCMTLSWSKIESER